MFTKQSIFNPQTLPPGNFGGKVSPVTVSEPVNPVSVPTPPEPAPIPSRPGAHVEGSYLAFLANLHPQSQEMRERQSILLSKADTLRQEINEFSDALRAAEVERLRLRLEELQNSCRAAEDEVNRVRQEQGALQNALNEAGKKVNAATARWREVRGCPTPSRFPTPEETKAARELAEGARLALVEAQGEATRAAEAYSAWDSRMKKAAQEYDRLVWEHMKVQAAIEGKPLHDPQTALKAIPSEEQPGPLKLAVR